MSRGVWENCDFRPLSRFISKMMQDRVIVTIGIVRDLSNGAISSDFNEL